MLRNFFDFNFGLITSKYVPERILGIFGDKEKNGSVTLTARFRNFGQLFGNYSKNSVITAVFDNFEKKIQKKNRKLIIISKILEIPKSLLLNKLSINKSINSINKNVINLAEQLN